MKNHRNVVQIRKLLAYARHSSDAAPKVMAPPPNVDTTETVSSCRSANQTHVCARACDNDTLTTTLCVDPDALLVTVRPCKIEEPETDEQRQQRIARASAVARHEKETFREHANIAWLKKDKKLVPVRPPTGVSRLTFLRLQHEAEERRQQAREHARRSYDNAAE